MAQKRGRDQEESKFVEIPTARVGVPEGTDSHVRTANGGTVAGELADGSAVLSLGTGGLRLEAAEDSGDPTIIYVAAAPLGSATSAAVWQIKRFTITSPLAVVKEFADGDTAFDNIYDNREALAYS